MATCKAPECNRPARAAGLCTSHYQRERRGKPLDQPLRDRDRPQVSTRVARATANALRKTARDRGVPVYQVIADVLDEWAARKDTE